MIDDNGVTVKLCYTWAKKHVSAIRGLESVDWEGIPTEQSQLSATFQPIQQRHESQIYN
jgi:hypothetical protein